MSSFGTLKEAVYSFFFYPPKGEVTLTDEELGRPPEPKAASVVPSSPVIKRADIPWTAAPAVMTRPPLPPTRRAQPPPNTTTKQRVTELDKRLAAQRDAEAVASRRREAEDEEDRIRRRRMDFSSQGDSTNLLATAIILNSLSTPSYTSAPEPDVFRSGGGGNFGGGGASGDFAPSPAPAPAYESPAPSPSYERYSSPSPSYDSSSSSSSYDSGSSSSSSSFD